MVCFFGSYANRFVIIECAIIYYLSCFPYPLYVSETLCNIRLDDVFSVLIPVTICFLILVLMSAVFKTVNTHFLIVSHNELDNKTELVDKTGGNC